MACLRPIAVLAATFACTALAAQDAAPTPRRVSTSLGMVTVLHDRPEAAAAKLTLWARYAEDHDAFADHRQYLEDLQARYGERGVTIAVLLPDEAAKALAAASPRFVVGTHDNAVPTDAPAMLLLCRGTSDDLFAPAALDGVVDAFDRALAGDGTEQLTTDDQALQQLLARVADGGPFGELAKASLQAWPHSGRAHAAAVLCHWWCEGDLAAGRAAVDTGLEALANDAVPLTVFADLVLRGDRQDREIAKRIAVAIAPAAAAAPDGAFTQLVHLRALLRAGQDRLAGRLAATLPKRLAGRAADLLVFAETLMEADAPAPLRDAAIKAIAEAERLDAGIPDKRWPWAARHKVLVRCGDTDAAAKLMEEYRAQDVASFSLNNDAWYLMVQPVSMGRFDTLALAQCEEMLRVEGAGIDYNSKDTTALACYLNGQLERAIEMQTEVVKVARGTDTYAARLRRFEATRDASKAAAAPKDTGRK